MTSRLHPAVLLHRHDHVAGLVSHRLQRGPREMRAGVEPGQADDHPARVGAPVRREQTRERRDEVQVAAVLDRRGQGFTLGGIADDAQLVTQPLDRANRSPRWSPPARRPAWSPNW